MRHSGSHLQHQPQELRVAPPTNAIDARLPPLPVGRLSARTLHIIGIGRLVHFRTGPWVLLVEDGSRVVRIHDGSEPPLFVEPPQVPALFRRAEPAVPERQEPPATPAPSRAVVLATPPRRRGGARRHRARIRGRSEHA
jgi:hypothetical protein